MVPQFIKGLARHLEEEQEKMVCEVDKIADRTHLMKDIVENRQRLTWGQKFAMGRLAIKENGFLWTAMLGIYYAFSGVADKAFAAMSKRRIKKNLPGLNSAAMNRLIFFWRPANSSGKT